mgnify:CR=1 FL=1
MQGGSGGMQAGAYSGQEPSASGAEGRPAPSVHAHHGVWSLYPSPSPLPAALSWTQSCSRRWRRMMRRPSRSECEEEGAGAVACRNAAGGLLLLAASSSGTLVAVAAGRPAGATGECQGPGEVLALAAAATLHLPLRWTAQLLRRLRRPCPPAGCASLACPSSSSAAATARRTRCQVGSTGLLVLACSL